jgi:hypothetical protein
MESSSRKRNRAVMSAVALAALMIMASTLGCGGNSSVAAPHTASSQKVQVVARAQGTENTHALNITLLIQH